MHVACAGMGVKELFFVASPGSSCGWPRLGEAERLRALLDDPSGPAERRGNVPGTVSDTRIVPGARERILVVGPLVEKGGASTVGPAATGSESRMDGALKRSLAVLAGSGRDSGGGQVKSS